MLAMKRASISVLLALASFLPVASIQAQAAAYAPAIVSDVPSLRGSYAQSGPLGGTITVRNLSRRPVMALRLQIGASQNCDSWTQEVYWDGREELIAPGASHSIDFDAGRSSREIHGRYVQVPPCRTVVLDTVLFRDGSYEGKMWPAAQMTARMLGTDTVRQRIRDLAAPILAGAQPDSVKCDRILAAAAQLPVSSDAQMISALHARFPELSDVEVRRLTYFLNLGMATEKETFLQNFRQNARYRQENLIRMPLAQWWAILYGK